MEAPEFLDVGGTSIAVRRQAGNSPGIVWLGGYRSDMRGTKAEALARWSAVKGRAFLRHDYSGHGESEGEFLAGTITKWFRESMAVLDRFGAGRQLLVGSSMGAWVALMIALELSRRGDASRAAGLVLLAPAPDFTTDLVEPSMTRAEQRELARRGYFERRSKYGAEPDLYSRDLIEDGRANRLLGRPLDTHCPVHVVQGLADRDVPYEHALRLVACLPADDVSLSLVPDGDHRLSRPQDVELIIRAVEAILERVEPG